MKNNNFFPFERNRYFYGKLLSVNDFELEQNYMNNKRRMQNRMLYGSGVVAGLNAVAVGDKDLSLEMGMAIDFTGREIVVDEPIRMELSKIDGFDAYEGAGGDSGYLYLCIEYEEWEKEAVHNIAGNSGHANDSSEYNKYREGYRLYLTNKEPDEGVLSQCNAYEKTQTIYMGHGVRVRQSLPKFCVTGEKVPLTIQIENIGGQQSMAFTYHLKLSGLTYKGESRLKASFHEKLFDKSDRYELHYELNVVDMGEGEGFVDVDGFRMSLEGREVKVESAGRMRTRIGNREGIGEIEDRYFKKNVDKVLGNAWQIGVYLCKILFVRAGDSYSIQSIRNFPFRQYIWNTEINRAINQHLQWEVHKLRNEVLRLKGGRDVLKEREKEGEDTKPLFQDGMVEILFDEMTRRGQRYYSEEITHGLGMGHVTVLLGFVGKEDQTIYGSTEVFGDVETFAEVAAKVDEDRGTIRIGVRLLQATNVRKCRVWYTILKNPSKRERDDWERKIHIKPNLLKLKQRESYYLQVVCDNMEDERVFWSVKEDSGTIGQDGKYTAPNEQGIYEVTARSVAYPECKASILVVVKEEALDG